MPAVGPSRGTWDGVRRASAYGELDSKCKEINDLYWFGPSYRVIAFTSSRHVAFLRWINCMIVRIMAFADLGSSVLLYIGQEASLLVG